MIYYISNNLFQTDFKTATIEEAVIYLSDKTEIGIDIETTRLFKKNRYKESVYKPGLDPFVSDIIMFQIGDINRTYVIDYRIYKNQIHKFKLILEDPSIKVIAHNAKFEGKFLLHKQNIHLTNVWDTMICEKILYNGNFQSYSLGYLMEKYLGIKNLKDKNLFNIDEDDEYVDKSTRLEFINWGAKPFTKSQIEYGAMDVKAALQIYNIQKKGRLVNNKLYCPNLAFKLENKFTQVLAKIELTGMPFNSIKWINTCNKQSTIYEQRLMQLDKYVINNYPNFTSSPNLFSKDHSCDIQWSSSQQVIKFFRYLNICPKEKSKQTGKLEWTVGAKSLFKLLTNDLKIAFYENKFPKITGITEFILAYLLLKKSEQCITTFGKDWLKYVHPITGRVHSSYSQYKNTGRLSSTNPNLQNIPGGEDYRNCFSNGKYYINCDYSGQESIMLASISQVPSLVNFYKNGHEIFGTDLHSYAATNMFRVLLNDPNLIITKKTDKKKRDIAKAFNFKLAYGGSAFTIKDEIGKSLKETEILLKNYFAGFPGLLENFEKTKKTALKQGWIQLCPYTDKRYFFPYFEKMQKLKTKAYSLTTYKQGEKIPDVEKTRLKTETDWSKIWKEYMAYKGSLERRSLNYRIQGGAASQMKLAGVIFYNNRTDNSQNIMNVIHDEFLVESDNSLLEETSTLLKKSMEEGGNLVLNGLTINANPILSKVWEH